MRVDSVSDYFKFAHFVRLVVTNLNGMLHHGS